MLILHPSLALQVRLEHQIERLSFQSWRRWYRSKPAWHRRNSEPDYVRYYVHFPVRNPRCVTPSPVRRALQWSRASRARGRLHRKLQRIAWRLRPIQAVNREIAAHMAERAKEAQAQAHLNWDNAEERTPAMVKWHSKMGWPLPPPKDIMTESALHFWNRRKRLAHLDLTVDAAELEIRRSLYAHLGVDNG